MAQRSWSLKRNPDDWCAIPLSCTVEPAETISLQSIGRQVNRRTSVRESNGTKRVAEKSLLRGDGGQRDRERERERDRSPSDLAWPSDYHRVSWMGVITARASPQCCRSRQSALAVRSSCTDCPGMHLLSRSAALQENIWSLDQPPTWLASICACVSRKVRAVTLSRAFDVVKKTPRSQDTQPPLTLARGLAYRGRVVDASP